MKPSAPTTVVDVETHSNGKPTPRTPGTLRLVDAVIDQLEAWGVRFVYGVVGDTILPFVSALGERDQIAFIPARHEEAAVFMAKAQAKLTGELAVCIATSGPGAAHMVNGLADAKTDSAAVLAITGQVESYNIGGVYKQFIDQQQLLGAVADYSAQLSHPGAVVDILSRAMRSALVNQTVAHVSIPKDFWPALIGQVHVRGPEPYLRTPTRSFPHVIDGAMELLTRAQRPIILAGIGIRAAVGSVFQLAERLNAPVLHTLATAGQIPGLHPLSIGGIGEGGNEYSTRLLAEADLVVRLGTTWWPETHVPIHVQTLDINSRPDHLGLRSPAAYGIVGPVQDVIPEILHRLPMIDRPWWQARVAEERQAWDQQMTHELNQAMRGADGGVHPAAIVHELNTRIPDDSIITLDVGDHVLWFNRYFRGSGRQDILISGYWRSMGFGLPAAIGAKLTHADRTVVALVGDGGFGMSLAELATAVRLQLPITVIVFNNHSLAMEENEMKKLGLNVHGVGLTNPDFSRFARLCGADGHRVTRAAQLSRALERAWNNKGPTVIDVVTAPTKVPSPAPLQQEMP